MLTALGLWGLRFQTGLRWGWVALAFVLAGVILFWLYRRLHGLYPRKQAAVLMSLKLGAAAVLLLALLRPAIVQEEKDLSGARIILMIDDSRSMTTRDGNLAESRLDEASRAAFDKLLPRLRRSLSVETVAFSANVRSIERAEDLKGAGEGTDIAGAIQEAARNYAGSARAGAFVLVTDGGDANCAEPAFAPGAPVFALAVGSDLTESDDLRIGKIEYPEQADAKTEFEVHAQAAISGRAEFLSETGSPVLTLSEGGKPVASQAVRFTAGERQCRVTLRVQAPETGVHRYKLQLPVFKTEAATLNNERDFVVEVRNPSLRVFYYASAVGQEFKPLRNALKGDPGIGFTSLVRTGADRFQLQGQQPEDKFESSFPASIEQLRRFKCIFLAGCDARDLAPAALKALEQFTAEGGALVLTGGPHAFGLGGWSATPLAPAFPWQIASSEPAFRTEDVALELTPLGRAHPIFQGITGIAGSNPRLSKFEGYNVPGPLRAGAEGLLAGVPASGERPALIAVNHYGKGKVLGVASNTLWKWNTAGGEGEKACNAFWRQAVRYLASAKDDGCLLRLMAGSQGHYRAGARAQVTARVLDRSLQPLAGAQLNATLKRLDGTTAGPVAFREDRTAGTYLAGVDLGAAGDYRLQVSASDSKGLLETRELLLQAGGGLDEGLHLAVNTEYLDELARQTGGAVRPENKADELAELVLDGVRAKTQIREVSLLWDSPVFFLLFLGLMTAEWIARRRMNLI